MLSEADLLNLEAWGSAPGVANGLPVRKLAAEMRMLRAVYQQDIDAAAVWQANARAEIARLRAALQHCQALAGAPDAAQGCRNIIRAVGEALGDQEGGRDADG